MPPPLEDDIAAIGRISAVPTILQVIAGTTGMGLTLIARVTPDRWVACAVRDEISFGMKVGDELQVATTICSEVRDSLEPIVIEHASREPEFCGHPTPKLYNFESYIAVPVFRKSGEYFGNVCALDRKPALLREAKTLAMMKLFAELISLQLQAEEDLARSDAELREHKSAGELREQFIAVLGHDLRNPLGSIVTGTELLLTSDLPAAARTTIERVRRSARRIELLADGLLDLTRGRLGGGLPLALAEVHDLERALRHVVDEVASQRPERELHVRVVGSGSIVCDRPRVEQVLSNLLGNAMHHTSAEQPVRVTLAHTPDAFTIEVQNGGSPIPQDVLPQLFQPFYRAKVKPRGPREGLGLGLYIVAEVARAHRGTATMTSSAVDGTVFTVRLPKDPPA
jgi:signal transduction histidine kinase